MARRIAADRRRTLLATGAAVGAAALFAPAAQAANFTVTTDADSGAGSLRAAVISANTTPNADATHPDTIDFDKATWADDTITLTGGQIAITESLTINGPGRS